MKQYRVMRYKSEQEFRGNVLVIYRAGEPFEDHTSYDVHGDGTRWSDPCNRSWTPDSIDLMPCGPEKCQAVDAWFAALGKETERAIVMAFPESIEGKSYGGQIVASFEPGDVPPNDIRFVTVCTEEDCDGENQ